MSYKLVELGKIANFINGYAFKPSQWEVEGKPIIRIQNLTDNDKPFNYSTMDVPEKYYVSSGDLLVSWSATLDVFEWEREDALLNQHIFKVVPNYQKIDKGYLQYALKEAIQSMMQFTRGSTMKHVNRGDFLGTKIPLPPLPVQKQIAAVLEKADTLRQQCQQMEQELNALAQSVFLDMFGDPITNPKGFDLFPLGELSNVQIGPFGTMLHKSDYITGGIPLINPTHIVKSQISPSFELTITESKYSSLPQYHLFDGDIIMGRRGEMGRCAIVEGKSVGYFCGTGSLYIRPNQQKIRSRFLNDLLSSGPIKKWFEEQSLGATMPNLNKGIVNKLLVPLPKLEMQIRYENILANISNRLENHRDLKGVVDSNFNSLMQRVFKGELELKDVA